DTAPVLNSWWEESMRSGILRGTLLTLTVLAFVVAIATAEQPDQKGHQNRGTAAAKAVAPGQVKKFHVTAYDGKIAPSTLRAPRDAGGRCRSGPWSSPEAASSVAEPTGRSPRTTPRRTPRSSRSGARPAQPAITGSPAPRCTSRSSPA